MILKMLKKMFPEADSHCFETARLFYGGKGLIDFNDVVAETGENTFNVYNLVMQFEKFLYTNDKKNFSRNIRVFAHKYQIGLSNNRFNIFLYNDKSIKVRGLLFFYIKIPHTPTRRVFLSTPQSKMKKLLEVILNIN